jgi:hypothetical protein
MMAVIETVQVDSPAAIKERLEEFGREVLAEAMNRPAQMTNSDLYLRGLIEQAPRKSLEPMVERLGDEADYQCLAVKRGRQPRRGAFSARWPRRHSLSSV